MRIVMAAVLAALWLTLPTPAFASCAEDAGPGGSPVIFLGTVDQVRGPATRLDVDVVLAGPDLAPTVWVGTGEPQPPWPLSWFTSVSGSTETELVEGHSYVVGAGRDFSTNLCSVRPVDGEISMLTYGEPRDPTAAGLTGIDPPARPAVVAALTAVGLVATVLGTVALVRRRR